MIQYMSFVVFGRPAPQGSKDQDAAGNMFEASRFLPAWRDKVKLGALRARSEHRWDTTDAAVAVDLLFALRRPARTLHTDYPGGQPDSDKLARAVLDMLTQAGVYVDDSRVVDLAVSKRWAPFDILSEPGVHIRVEVLR